MKLASSLSSLEIHFCILYSRHIVCLLQNQLENTSVRIFEKWWFLPLTWPSTRSGVQRWPALGRSFTRASWSLGWLSGSCMGFILTTGPQRQRRGCFVTSRLSPQRPRAASCLWYRFGLRIVAERKLPILLLENKTVSLWWAASCFCDLLLMCFVSAPKDIQLGGVPPQAAGVCQQLEEDQCPQRREPHLQKYRGDTFPPGFSPMAGGSISDLEGNQWVVPLMKRPTRGLGWTKQQTRLWSWAWLTSDFGSAIILWDSRGSSFRTTLVPLDGCEVYRGCTEALPCSCHLRVQPRCWAPGLLSGQPLQRHALDSWAAS